MNGEEIRARIAELEAEAERRAQAESTRRGRNGAGLSGDPWDLLFDSALLRGGGLDGDEFSLNDWLADGLRGLRTSLHSAGLNDEFWGHLRGAERELLLAARVLIDARLERLDDRDKGAGEANGRQEIEIDFD